MFKTLLTAGALLLAPMSVLAQECEYRFDPIIGEFSAAGAPVEIIPEADLPKFVGLQKPSPAECSQASRAGFWSLPDGNILLGLEIDGCLIHPIVIGTSGQPASDRTSGRGVDGGIGA